ncbi:hypothetical protein [Corynebacterium silvaticum]|uniref:Secreted protein n=1 Tax=Corynebacterium silvaticum TaxID=2320431 RepID=A0A7Y4LG00_9CORY|nr:hypothetical protein [Corynebacterium silvaticum]ARU46437.1 hypothetical protein CBE74_08060 [Corynebacterium silvaticum]MBH5299580.1 hypothetical protein [Corynebacterium silvaticum]NOM64101.1 hypothetical protein [Corynebacterium silvaticum]NON69306.1 hypothetical protein [Corynebacterium silvaticum]TFA93954.1 hypothetical protein EU802_00860 [Corynebacterium silvaticum]
MLNRIHVNRAKKIAIAVAASSALVLTACGDEDDSKENKTTSATTSSSVATTASETSASPAAPSTEEPTPAASPAPAPQGNNVPPAAINEAMPELTYNDVPPIDGGAPATDADRQAIENLVRGINGARTIRDYIGYVPAHTCQRVINEQGGPAAFDLSQFPDVPLDDFEEYRKAKPSIDNVDSVQVNGNIASASVTATANGDTNTATQRFERENGKWKFCR